MRHYVVYGLRSVWWLLDVSEKAIQLSKAILEALIAIVNDWPAKEKP